MSTNSTPADARTSHLRTLSKIFTAASPSGPAPQGVSLKGAAHLTADFEFVNTPKPTFFSPPPQDRSASQRRGAHCAHSPAHWEGVHRISFGASSPRRARMVSLHRVWTSRGSGGWPGRPLAQWTGRANAALGLMPSPLGTRVNSALKGEGKNFLLSQWFDACF